MNKEKIIFFGTSKISVQCLEEFLMHKNLEIALVITKKDSALEKFSLEQNLQISHELGRDLIAKINADKFAVVDFGVIIPLEILKLAPKGAYNLHFSLLPKYRGASPVQSAILNGEKISGVSIIEVSEKMDAGKIFAQENVEIAGMRADEVFAKMLSIGAPLFAETVSAPSEGIPQNENEVSLCKKISKQNGLIKPSEELMQNFINKVNAYHPWPSVYFTLPEYGHIKIHRACVAEKEITGKGLFKQQNRLFLELKDGFVEIQEIQREGKRNVSGEEFSRGMR